jgi:glucose/arabinose dehydrogenase
MGVAHQLFWTAEVSTGPDLVPDYLTSVQEGGFYGWPSSYWGQNVDPRAQPQDPEKVAAAIRPDYSLGSHARASRPARRKARCERVEKSVAARMCMVRLL